MSIMKIQHLKDKQAQINSRVKVMINGFEFWYDRKTKTVFEVIDTPTGSKFKFLTQNEIREIQDQLDDQLDQ